YGRKTRLSSRLTPHIAPDYGKFRKFGAIFTEKHLTNVEHYAQNTNVTTLKVKQKFKIVDRLYHANGDYGHTNIYRDRTGGLFIVKNGVRESLLGDHDPVIVPTASQLRAMQKFYKWNRKKLVEMTGVSPNTARYWLSDDKKMTRSAAAAIQDYITWFLTEDF
ncbi:MAG: hypothetical protein HUJ16_03010, partial [Kangiella sp.]|nr:hypothetical protein [Kangiella sp.]